MKTQIGAMMLMVSLALGACGNRGEKPLDETLIREVSMGDLVDEVVESGRIAPVYEVDIKARVSGEVDDVFVEEGDWVQQDQALMKLEDTDYVRRVKMADVDVAEAQLNLKNAQIELRRKKQALDARGISEFEYDLALRQVELGRVRLSRANVNLEAASDSLGYTTVRAPMDGTVIRRNVDPGELITAGLSATVNGEAQLTIARIDTLLMELSLNQVDVAKARVGQVARILLDAYPGVEVAGKVTGIAAAGRLDRDKGIDVFDLRVEVDPSAVSVDIKPGMTAEVRIQAGRFEGVLKVPAETVFEEAGQSYIYVVHDDAEAPGGTRKDKVEVTVGRRGTRELEITEGLSEGMKIYAKADVKDLSGNAH